MKAVVALLVVTLTLSSITHGFVVRPNFASRSSSSSSSSSSTYHRCRSPPATTTTTSTTTSATHVCQMQQWAMKEQQQQERERPAELKFISILSESGTSDQMLPVASASSFPLWVLEGDVDVDDNAGRRQVTQVPGANQELGWVNPRSYNELWIPEDSPVPSMKLCLGMLLKDGVPRPTTKVDLEQKNNGYVMPMVDLVVSKEGQKWRNRGLNSVPVAHTWEPVGRAATGSLYLSAYVEEKVQGSETDSMWGTLAEKVPVTDAFTDIVSVLADPPGGLDLGSGFHYLVAEVAVAGADAGAGVVGPLAVAACGGRVRVFLTDLPEPADLLDLEELGASGGGVRGVAALGFDVVSVANGGKSEFLPEVYRPFFEEGGRIAK
ncbi:unnamed protein product [Pylaiella littoralis]